MFQARVHCDLPAVARWSEACCEDRLTRVEIELCPPTLAGKALYVTGCWEGLNRKQAIQPRECFPGMVLGGHALTTKIKLGYLWQFVAVARSKVLCDSINIGLTGGYVHTQARSGSSRRPGGASRCSTTCSSWWACPCARCSCATPAGSPSWRTRRRRATWTRRATALCGVDQVFVPFMYGSQRVLYPSCKAAVVNKLASQNAVK